MKIGVVGAGYVGIVTGLSLARMGSHSVTFVESSTSRLESLRSGLLPIFEPGLQEVYAAHRHQLGFTESVTGLDNPDIIFVAVATPIGDNGESDLGQLRQACRDLNGIAAPVCFRSTIPPGISAKLPAMLGRTDGSAVCTNPEFLRQGSALYDFANPARIILGSYSDTGRRVVQVLESLYAPITAPWVRVGVESAALIKNVANGYLAMKLSYMNEVAGLCEELSVDVNEVIAGISLDPRIGAEYMAPGIGFGGSCLPKELEAVAAAGLRFGLPMHLTRAASLVNVEQQHRVARLIEEHLDSADATGGRVALLGLSFKPNTDDLRGSPSIVLARRFLHDGHEVVAHDPVASGRAAVELAPGIQIAESPEAAAEAADAVVIATAWPQYTSLDWQTIANAMRGRLVFDGHRRIDREAVRRAGLIYRAVGQPAGLR